MDLKQIENIIVIYDERSIAKAADKLFITQSALNQQLLKLEKELGALLFERRYHEMIPTFAGRVYIDAARKMVGMKQETYKIIKDISGGTSGEISIAYTPERGSKVFSNVYPVFHREYPDFQVKTFEARVPKAKELLFRHEVTFAQMTFSKINPLPKEFEKRFVHREYIILVMPETHPLAHLAGRNSAVELPLIDLELLKEEPFLLCSKETSLRKMIDYIFEENKMKPRILFESASSTTILQMVLNDLGIAFLPGYYADASLPLVYFRARPELYWNTCIACLKGTYITKAEQRFIELMSGDPIA